MECVPAARLDVVRLAFPPESKAEPRDVSPSLNTIVPVGTALKADVTVAVNATASPGRAGFRSDETAVELTEQTRTFPVPSVTRRVTPVVVPGLLPVATTSTSAKTPYAANGVTRTVAPPLCRTSIRAMPE